MTPRARTALAAVSAANLLQNLLFPILALRTLGASNAADALFMVFILPGVVMVLLGNSVLNWSTPRLVRRADDTSRRVLCWSLLWTLQAGVLLLCFALWLGAWLVLPYVQPAGGYALAIGVLPLGLLAMLATVVTAIGQSLFTAESDVLGSEFRTFIANLIAMAAWFVFDPATLVACAALFALRAVLVAALLLPRLGVPRKARLHDADLRDVLRESRVLLLAATYYKSEPFVDRLLFASVPGGAVAAFHLAQQVLSVVTLMMNRVITAPLVAPFAERMHAGDGPGARILLRTALGYMAAVGIAVWILFVVAGELLVRLLFSGTAYSAEHIALTAQMLTLLGGFMLAVLFGQVLAQVFYCSGETRRMVVLSVGGYTVGLLLKVLALWQFGVMGLVAASSLSWLLNVSAFRLVVPGILRRVAARGAHSAGAAVDPAAARSPGV
ncbi:MAG: lipid II flippase MurJ [Pseudomonadota bacterium]